MTLLTLFLTFQAQADWIWGECWDASKVMAVFVKLPTSKSPGRNAPVDASNRIAGLIDPALATSTLGKELRPLEDEPRVCLSLYASLYAR